MEWVTKCTAPAAFAQHASTDVPRLSTRSSIVEEVDGYPKLTTRNPAPSRRVRSTNIDVSLRPRPWTKTTVSASVGGGAPQATRSMPKPHASRVAVLAISLRCTLTLLDGARGNERWKFILESTSPRGSLASGHQQAASSQTRTNRAQSPHVLQTHAGAGMPWCFACVVVGFNAEVLYAILERSLAR